MTEREVAMLYRPMRDGEETAVSALVHACFMRYVAPDMRANGVDTFLNFAAPERLRERLAAGGIVLVAQTGEQLAGMIEMREDRHIALLFVAAAYQRQGVAGSLLQGALGICLRRQPDLAAVTVNSSPYAVGIYERLGFHPTGPAQERDGIRFTPMVLDRPAEAAGARPEPPPLPRASDRAEP